MLAGDGNDWKHSKQAENAIDHSKSLLIACSIHVFWPRFISQYIINQILYYCMSSEICANFQSVFESKNAIEFLPAPANPAIFHAFTQFIRNSLTFSRASRH